MKKLFFTLIVLITLLTGCSNESLEDLALQSEFSMSFDTLNLESGFANFTVNGLPNEEEFNQIPTVINDSLTALEVEEKLTVNVYSNMQSKEEDPYYGVATFSNGELDSAELSNISMEQYLNQSAE